MAQDIPNSAVLLEDAAEWLKQNVRPLVKGPEAFQLRVVENILAIVGRELRQDKTVALREREQLRELLGQDSALEQLQEELIRRIREDRLEGIDRSLLFDYLRCNVAQRLAINSPKYIKTAR